MVLLKNFQSLVPGKNQLDYCGCEFKGILYIIYHDPLLFGNGVSVSGGHKEAAYVHVTDFRRLKHGAIRGQTPSQFLSTWQGRLRSFQFLFQILTH